MDIHPDYNFLKGNCKHNSYYLDCEFNDLVSRNNLNNKFSVLHINARSLNTNIYKILLILAKIKLNVTIIAITKTWENEANNSFLKIPGYNSYLKSRTAKKGGGCHFCS